ncbi:hypothetical protein ACFX1X_002543 [Malus domestica]
MCKLSSPLHNPTMDILKTESGIHMNVRSSPLADEEVKGKVCPASPSLHCFLSKNAVKGLKHISRDHFAMALSRASVPPTSSVHPWKYDVFLRFTGEDTCKDFTDHLYDTLQFRAIKNFQRRPRT